jgi:hypothetical protein
MREALADPQLLGGVLAGDSWFAWRVLLVAAMGEELTEEERVVFTALTGREREPPQRVEELLCVIGRRGGKSRAVATLACYLSGLCQHNLVAGERGVCLCIAPDTGQAAITLEYCAAAFEQSPMLSALVSRRSSDAIELTGNVSVEVRAASFRRLRGPTYIAVIADECAFWYSDEFSSNADTEILTSVRPGLATTSGPLILVSSPYARKGEVWETYRRHYGASGDALILVAQGASRDLNPSLPQAVVDRALERDRPAAEAEYLAKFRTDIESFVSYEVAAAAIGGHVEMTPLADVKKYFAFCDPAGGSGSDSFTLAIAHLEGDRTIIDVVRERRPPFSPETTIAEFCDLLKSYRVRRVMGDRFAGEFPREQFLKRNIAYRVCDRSKSDLYTDLLPLLNSGRITLPKNDRLLNQLVGLERRVSRAGRDSIDHVRNGHDDCVNACAGVAFAIAAAHAQRNRVPVAEFGHYGTPDPAPPTRSPKYDGEEVWIQGPNGERVRCWATRR